MDPNSENNRADPIESTKEVTNVSKTFVTYKYGKKTTTELQLTAMVDEKRRINNNISADK